MEDSRWQNEVYQWIPQGRRRRGRSQKLCMNQVTHFMGSKNMEEDMERDRYFPRLGVDGRLSAV